MGSLSKNCALTGDPFEITEQERDYCERNSIPLPTVSPRERLRNMLVFRNRPYLYNSTCRFSKKKILSCIPPESGFAVYDAAIWQSDQWDPRDYGRGYDFAKPFFEQFYDLYRTVPLPNLAVALPTMENSAYTNGISGAKNCYLVFTSSYNEDCMFSYALWRSKDLVDCVYVADSELCYQCTDVQNGYNLKFCEHCANCSDSAFLFNCSGCRDCYLCAGISQQQYCFANEKLTREEYERRIRGIDLGSFTVLEQEKERFREFVRQFPIKYYFGKENSECTGNYVRHSKNCRNCFFVSGSEDLVNCMYLDKAKSSILHAMFGNGSELVYNSISSGESVYNLKFCAECWMSSHDLEYCIFCIYGCAHCFGCVGLKKASYCILNKEYDRAEYFDLVRRIKTQMRADNAYGHFFPPGFSPFYYNESEVLQYLPLERDAALKWGFSWREEDAVINLAASQFPEHIADVQDEILQQTFCCESSKKPYRIIKPELSFYQRQNLPIPRISPMERIRSKLGFFEIAQLETACCSKCGQGFSTVYSHQSAPVYCEQCFQQTMFS